MSQTDLLESPLGMEPTIAQIHGFTDIERAVAESGHASAQQIYGFTAWSDDGVFSRSLGLKYQKILPRQE